MKLRVVQMDHTFVWDLQNSRASATQLQGTLFEVCTLTPTPSCARTCAVSRRAAIMENLNIVESRI
jgi:hypothetical protein